MAVSFFNTADLLLVEYPGSGTALRFSYSGNEQVVSPHPGITPRGNSSAIKISVVLLFLCWLLVFYVLCRVSCVVFFNQIFVMLTFLYMTFLKIFYEESFAPCRCLLVGIPLKINLKILINLSAFNKEKIILFWKCMVIILYGMINYH